VRAADVSNDPEKDKVSKEGRIGETRGRGSAFSYPIGFREPHTRKSSFREDLLAATGDKLCPEGLVKMCHSALRGLMQLFCIASS
jgi:hypothetical protein